MDNRETTPPKFVKDYSLKSKMLTRLSKKTGPAKSGRDTKLASKLRVSPYLPRNINGDFKGLQPINPGRQRITVDQSQMSNEQSIRERIPSNESDMYPNVIIYGKAEKLYGVGPFSSDRKMSNQSNNERMLSNEFKTINSSNATGGGGMRYVAMGNELAVGKQVEMHRIYE